MSTRAQGDGDSPTPWQRALLAGGVGLALLVIVRSAWICDDALITFRTLEHFVNGEGLRWNLAERVQAFTHPLWLMLLTPFYAITREAFYTPIAVSLLASAGALFLLAFRVAPGVAPGLALLASLTASKSFVDYSTSGLENPLTHLLFAAFLATSLYGETSPRRFGHQVGIACLLALCRPDAILLALPALGIELGLVLYRGERSGPWLRAAAVASTPLVVWLAFSLVYYGAPIPNTAYAKLGTGIPGVLLAQRGIVYLASLSHYDPASLLILVAGLAASVWNRRLAPYAAGLVLHLLYVVQVGGDFMSGRFVSATVMGAAALLAQRQGPSWLGPGLAAGAVVLSLASPYSAIRAGADYDQRDEVIILRWQGIADERGFYFRDRGLLAPAANHDLRPGAACSDGSTRDGQVLIRGHCGGLGYDGYAACPGAHLVDICALTDPLLARLPAINPRSFRTGHYLRRPPAGYRESLRDGDNQLTDPALRSLYEDVRLATRAPLFAPGRWPAILRLLAGSNAARENR